MSPLQKSSTGPRLTPPASAVIKDEQRLPEQVQPTLSLPELGDHKMKMKENEPLRQVKEIPSISISDVKGEELHRFNVESHETQQNVGVTSDMTSLTERTQHRSPTERAEQLTHRFRALAVLLTALVLFLSYDALTTLELFQLRTVTFSGLQQIERDSLNEFLHLDQIRPSLINPSLNLIETEVKSHPWVKEADASVHLEGTIHIKVTEYQAAAIAVLDELYLVTPNGIPFALARPTDLNSELPMISGVAAELFKQSQKSSLIGQYWLKRGIELAGLVKQSGLTRNHHLSDIHISETGRYEIILDNIRISLGTDLLVERLAKVEELLNRLERKGVSAAYILLSDDLNRAIVKEVAIPPQESKDRRPE